MKNRVFRIIALGFLLRLVLSFGPYHPDLGNHLDWGVKFWELGPKYFYENLFWRVSWANQPPGTIYLFALARKIYEAIFGALWWLNLKISIFPSSLIPFFQERLYVSLVKLPSIIADLGIGFIIYKFISGLKDQKAGQKALLIFLFNPAVWYNSAVWGQTDGLVNFFGLWSLYLFWRKKPLRATFIFLLSLYFKGSLLIFSPIIFILLLKSEAKWWKKILVTAGTPIILAYLSFPFVRWMSPVPWLYHLYKDRIFGHQGNMLTANAFNIWAMFFGIDFTRNDLGIFLGLTYKIWGQVLLVLSILPVLFTSIIKKVSTERVLWAITIVSFASFFLLTNMHERYLYPVFPYLTILLFLRPELNIFYSLLSSIFFLNLYHLWYVPHNTLLKFILTPFSVKFFSFGNLILLVWFLSAYFRFLRLKKI